MSDEKRIANYYEEKLEQFGLDPRSVGWRDRETQRKRFHALLQVAPLTGRSVLDLGCGTADLYEYITEQNIELEYTGWDLSHEMIARCRERFPDANFERVNIIEDRRERAFDIVIGCGLFCIPLEDDSFYEQMMRRTFALCREAAAFNLISDYVDFQEDYLRYTGPEQTFAFCKKMSRYVTLRHDYMPFEYAVYVYRKED